MVEWLRQKEAPVDDRLKKKDLYDVVKQHKVNFRPVYKVDSYLQSHGHHVVRLPPHHCELNPIELVWSDVKRFVASKNTTFKKEDVRQLIDEGFEQVTAGKWANYCRHVADLEEKWRQRDNITPCCSTRRRRPARLGLIRLGQRLGDARRMKRNLNQTPSATLPHPPPPHTPAFCRWGF